MATFKWKPFMATPNAVPEAGGCSVSVMTMRKIESPTAIEYMIALRDG